MATTNTTHTKSERFLPNILSTSTKIFKFPQQWQGFVKLWSYVHNTQIKLSNQNSGNISQLIITIWHTIVNLVCELSVKKSPISFVYKVLFSNYSVQSGCITMIVYMFNHTLLLTILISTKALYKTISEELRS